MELSTFARNISTRSTNSEEGKKSVEKVDLKVDSVVDSKVPEVKVTGSRNENTGNLGPRTPLTHQSPPQTPPQTPPQPPPLQTPPPPSTPPFRNLCGTYAPFATGNHFDGFYVDRWSTGNSLSLNAANSNHYYGYVDASSGSGIAGTGNTYVGNTASGNTLGASNPLGL